MIFINIEIGGILREFFQCPVCVLLGNQLHATMPVNQIMRRENAVSCLGVAVRSNSSACDRDLDLTAIVQGLVRLNNQAILQHVKMQIAGLDGIAGQQGQQGFLRY